MATASVAALRTATGFPALAGLAAPRHNSPPLCSGSDKCREHETYASLDMRLAGALVATLGRKTVHRGRLGFIRAAARPCTALQAPKWHATGGVPTVYLQSCAWAGCGANKAQALAAGDPATQHGLESVRSARIEPGVRF